MDLLLDWLGFGQTSKTVVNSKQLNPNEINRRLAAH